MQGKAQNLRQSHDSTVCAVCRFILGLREGLSASEFHESMVALLSKHSSSWSGRLIPCKKQVLAAPRSLRVGLGAGHASLYIANL